MADHPSLTLNDRARASNPGRLDVQPLVYTRCFPRAPALFGLLLAAAMAAAVSFHGAFWLAVLLVLAAWSVWWTRVEEHFRHGCVNPGRVVSTRPLLVAVYTDLRRGRQPHPAIKVLPQPLDRADGTVPQFGEPVATVALYAAGEPRDRWEDFHPVAARCVTRCRRDLDRVLESLTPDDWRELDAGLCNLATPTRPGLYLLPHLPDPTVPSPPAVPHPAPPAAAGIQGLQLVLPSAPLLPWAAVLYFLAERVVLERSLPVGLLLLGAAAVVAACGDGLTQERLAAAGWPRHTLPMRVGYWVLGAASLLEALSGVETLSRPAAQSLKQGFFALSVGGILLALAGQSSWYLRLDAARRAVVDREARRYRRLIGVLVLLAVAVGVAVGLQRRARRAADPAPPDRAVGSCPAPGGWG